MDLEINKKVEDWLETLSISTQNRYRQVIKDFENYCIEAIQFGKFGIKRFFADYIQKLKLEGKKASTLQSVHSIICLWSKIRNNIDLDDEGNVVSKKINQLKKTQVVKQAKVIILDKITLHIILNMYINRFLQRMKLLNLSLRHLFLMTI